MSDNLSALKFQYNKALERNKKAEEYFKSHTVDECLNKKYKDGTPIEIFNKVVQDLSGLIIEIEADMGKKITSYERLNGFKL